MAESFGGRFDRIARSRSRSPFRKTFSERTPTETNKRPRRRDGSKERGAGGKNRVFVTNIPFECRWMELKDLFREKVGDVTFVELNEDDKGKFAGTGVVEFKDGETANKAVTTMHKFELRGRKLNVKIDNEPERSRGFPPRGMERDRREMDFGGGGGEFRRDQSYNTYGLNPEFLKSIGISGPLSTKLFISNLDYKVTEKKLEEIFKLAGKVVSVDLSLDAEGKSKGHAVAEMEHPLEAVQAISMFSGQRLYARNMHVRMDRFADEDTPSKLPSGLHGIGKGLGVGGRPMSFHKNFSSVSNGSGGFGIGIGGGMGGGGGGGMSLSGMGMSSSNLGMVSSPGLGMSSGGGGSMSMNRDLPSERNMMSSSSMGMSPLSHGMGGSSGMMSSGGMGMSPSMDNVMGRESFGMSSAKSSHNFSDPFDRSGDSYQSSAVSDTLILGNLPSSFSWQMLKDRFRDIGDVRFAELKGNGQALIRFGQVQDAQRAMDLMNGTRFDGRTMQIRFY